MTIFEAFDAFMDFGSSYWAPRTLLYYRKNIGYFLQFYNTRCAPELPVSELPDTLYAEYVVYLRAKEKYAGHPLRNSMNVNGCIKSNTVCTYSRATRTFLNWLYKNGHIAIKLTEDVKLPRKDDDIIVPLLAPEVVAIDSVFDGAQNNDLRNWCIIHLMLDAGLRSCEVISLTPSDLIFDSHAITINRSKFDKSRVVPMVPKLEENLREYVRLYKPSGTLFRKSTENKGINEDVIKSMFLRIKRNTNIDRIHPHLLRHTFATSFIMGGGNLEQLRLLLGHYDYAVTRLYLHLASQYLILHTDIYQLDPLFFKAGY